MPNSLHAALQWDHSNPFSIEPVTEDSPWTVINNTKKSELIDQQDTTNIKQKFKRNVTLFVPAQGSKPVTVSTTTQHEIKVRDKRKRHNEDEVTPKRAVKKAKSSQYPSGHQFIGIPWDCVNYSCAYDSLLTILLSVYTECQQNWKTVISQQECYSTRSWYII